jgi:hypothetical protein
MLASNHPTDTYKHGHLNTQSIRGPVDAHRIRAPSKHPGWQRVGKRPRFLALRRGQACKRDAAESCGCGSMVGIGGCVRRYVDAVEER